MKPLPVPPAARGGDARTQIAARAAFRHIFTRRDAHSTRFSRSLSLCLSLFPFPRSPPFSFLIHLARSSSRSLSHPLSQSLSRRSTVDHSPSGRQLACLSCRENRQCPTIGRHHNHYHRTSAVVQRLLVIIVFFMLLYIFFQFCLLEKKNHCCSQFYSIQPNRRRSSRSGLYYRKRTRYILFYVTMSVQVHAMDVFRFTIRISYYFHNAIRSFGVSHIYRLHIADLHRNRPN